MLYLSFKYHNKHVIQNAAMLLIQQYEEHMKKNHIAKYNDVIMNNHISINGYSITIVTSKICL